MYKSHLKCVFVCFHLLIKLYITLIIIILKRTIIHLVKENDFPFRTIESTVLVNSNQKEKLFKELVADYKNISNLTIAVLGLAFKPNTNDTIKSAAYKLIELLLENNAYVNAYDPLAINNFKKNFKYLSTRINYYDNIDNAIKDTDAALIITNWQSIINYQLDNYVKLMRNALIYDGRNCYSLDNIKNIQLNMYRLDM